MSNFVGCSGLTITNCIFKNGVNDGILLVNSSHIDIDKVTVNKPGHDCIYCYKILDVSVTNCTFVNRDNSSCRFDTVSGGKFLHNVCSSSGGGYAALELENAVTDIECAFNKVAKNVPGGIVARVHTTETRVNIHDNTLF
jgi:polygalacturonase